MNTNANVEAVSTINYSFTAIPTNLFMVLDNNCRSTLFSLIQLSTYYAKEDGYFYRTNSDLEFQTNLSKNVINASLDALYINGIIDVVPSAKGKGKKQSGKHFKVNFEKFLEYESISIEDAMKNEEFKIYTPNYKGTYTPSFNKNVTNIDTKCNTTLVTSLVPTLVTTLVKSDNNINNIENKDNIKNKEYIYNNINKENNINIYKEEIEEVRLIENPTSEKEEKENYENIEEVEDDLKSSTSNNEKEIEDNNNTFQLCEVGMLEEEINDTPMKESFRINLEDCINRLGDGCTTVAELEEKTKGLMDWVYRHNKDYSNEEYKLIFNQVADRFNQLEAVIINNNKQIEAFQDEMFNSMVLDPQSAKTQEQVKKEQAKEESNVTLNTKEELVAAFQLYKETIKEQTNLDEAREQFKKYCTLKDKLIREYNLKPMVEDIIRELDSLKAQSKAVLSNFNSQDKEITIEGEKTQENPLKSISYWVDDTKDYPF